MNYQPAGPSPRSAKPLPLRLRSDLVVSRERFGERRYVVVKDPLALRYFRLHEEEFALLQLVDGRNGFDEIRAALEERFAPQRFEPADMSHFVASMHQAGLLISHAAGQAAPLLERRRKAARRELVQKLLSPTAVRLRGIDPAPLFDRLLPCVRWCFTPAAAAAALLLVVAALGLFAVRHEEILRRLPTWQTFFTPSNLLLLAALMAGIKVVHELGHGLACRRFGGECHELGLMFLMFAPCLYCNVSDAWRLPKRQRVVVGAAGIGVELVLASLALFGWWFSEPGLFHQLCLGTMFVSGVSTLVVNGNPLLRYDGYFILSDLVEAPNLAEKSAAVVRRWFDVRCFGLDDEPDPMLPATHRGWYALYAVASGLYRLALSFSIVLFLMELLRPYRLEVLARGFAVVALTTTLVLPLVRFIRHAATQARRERVRKFRCALSTLTALLVVGGLCGLPLPQRVFGTLEIEPRGVEPVFVETPGVLTGVALRTGTPVVAGTVVARLENLDLDLEIARLQGDAAETAAQLSAARRERFQNAGAALRIPELQKSLAAVEEVLDEKRTQRARLTLAASRSGIVLPPPETPPAHALDRGELPEWHGTPLEPINRGATLVEGTLVCRIGDPHHWQALAAIDQTDVDLLRVGQTVDVRFDELPEVTVAAYVDEISRAQLAESPRRLSNKAGGELAGTTDRAGVERPQSATYQARLVLYDPRALLRIGLRGTARIHVPPQPAATRLWRWLLRTFHFQL